MRKLLLTLITILPIWSIYAQQPIMCVPRYNFPVSSSGVGTITQITGANNQNYGASNGVYDANGILRFYVQDDKFYDINSNVIGNMTSSSSSPTQYYRKETDREIAIVNVPGFCDKYYVIHTITGYSCGLNYLVYEIVDCSGPTPIVLMSNAPASTNPYVISSNVFDVSNGIAIRKANFNGVHYLYVCGMGINKYEITSTGIIFGGTLSTNSTTNYVNNFSFCTSELEISPDGKWLAWGKYLSGLGNADNGKIFKFELTDPNSPLDQGNLMVANSAPIVIPFTPHDDNDLITGLEFATNNDLYISIDRYSGTDGIYQNIHNTFSLTHISGTDNCLSSIERRLDDKMYTIDNLLQKYTYFDLTSFTITNINPFTIFPKSNCNIGSNLPYSLPDQIDGENYKLYAKGDLVIRDNPSDVGAEPYNIWLPWQGDIWNCYNNATCLSEQTPTFDASNLTTNRMRVIVSNISKCPSKPAKLHMYWTRARSGEVWPDHWIASVFNQVPDANSILHTGGGEITSTPITIPAMNPQTSMMYTQQWNVPNPSWYPIDATYPAGSDGIHPMICYLARIESNDDPMYNEQTNIAVGINVQNNNNINTANSMLLKIGPLKPIVRDGSIMINNPRIERENILGIQLSGIFTDIVKENINYVDLELESALYQRWIRNGSVGVGIEDMGHNRIRIIDYVHAEIGNVQIAPGEYFNLVPIVSYNTDNRLDENTKIYSFMINHFYNDRSTRSACVYEVIYSDEEVVGAPVGGFGDAGNDDDERSGNRLAHTDQTQVYTYDNKILIYPDKSWTKYFEINIYDMNGNLVKEIHHQNKFNDEVSIELKDFSKGIYMIKISNSLNSKSYKLIY